MNKHSKKCWVSKSLQGRYIAHIQKKQFVYYSIMSLKSELCLEDGLGRADGDAVVWLVQGLVKEN